MQTINKRLEAIEESIKSKINLAEVQSILDKIKQAAHDNNIVNGKITVHIKGENKNGKDQRRIRQHGL